MQHQIILDKARTMFSEEEYTKSMLLYKTLSKRNGVFFTEFAIKHMQMEKKTLGHTTYNSVQLFKKAELHQTADTSETSATTLKEHYNECLSLLREEDKEDNIGNLPLIETFSNIYPKSLVTFIQKECRKIDKLAVSLPDGKRATFWYDVNDKPRFALEEIVQQILKLDFPNESYKKHGIIGCEWWSQVRKPNEDITFHFDKDEGYATREKIFKFPYIGTVTYLTECGGPTMIFDHRTNNKNSFYTPKEPRDGFISMPAIGKHIKFDGELFHGVMGAMNSVTKESSRITFLINYWQYKPEEPNCVLFPYFNRMNQLSQTQREELINHVQTLTQDKIEPLCQDDTVTKHILPIIRGSHNFYISFPKTIERNKTLSFTTTHTIPNGFLKLEKVKRQAHVFFTLNYPDKWYWTITIDKKTPIVLTSSIVEKFIKCKTGRRKITIHAFTHDNNTEIVRHIKYIII